MSDDFAEGPERRRRSLAESLRRGVGVVVVVLIALPLLVYGGFWVLALPENLASDTASRLGAMPRGAHVLNADYRVESGHPVVSAVWHTCDSRPFLVGTFSIDLLSQKVIEAHSEDWGGDADESR